MKICDINPFIRYANMNDFSPANEFVYSYDSRLFYIIEGECEITIEDTDYTAKEDTLMLWHAGTKYCFKTYEDVKMIILNFDYTQMRNIKSDSISPIKAIDFDKNLVTELIHFEDCEGFNRPLVIENMHSIKKHLVKLVEKFNTVGLYHGEACSAILKEVLTKTASVSSYSKTEVLNKVDTVLEYLMENFDKEITNSDLGELTGYHSHYINRLMLKHTGITLRQQLINIRMDAAKEMLTQTDIPIYEIAEKCGFKNTAYFSNHFKDKIGLSPSKYRGKYMNLI